MNINPKEMVETFFNATKGVVKRNENTSTVKFLRATIGTIEGVLKSIDAYLKKHNVDVGEGYKTAKDKITSFTSKTKAHMVSAVDEAKTKGMRAFVTDKVSGVVGKIRDKFANDVEGAGPPPETGEKVSVLARVMDKLRESIDNLRSTTDNKVDTSEERQEETKKSNLEEYNKSFDQQKEREAKRKKEVEGEKDRFGKEKKPNDKKGFFGMLLGALMGLPKMFGGIFTKGGLTLAKFMGKGLWATMTRIVPWMSTKLAKMFGGTITKMMGGALKLAGRGAMFLGKQALFAAGRGILSAGAAALSPIGLTVLAAGAALYGGYKLYKYLTRNSTGSGVTSDLTRLRLHLYGYNDTKRDHYHRLFDLEMLMKDYHEYRNRSIVMKKFDNDFKEKVMTIFEVSRDQEEKYAILNTWFIKRFLPSWTAFMNALYSINPKIYLDDLDKLKPNEIFRLVSELRIPTNVHDTKQVPTFESPETLVDKQQIDDLLVKIREAVKKLTDEAKGKDPVQIAQEAKKQATDVKTKQQIDNNAIKNSATAAIQPPRENVPPPTAAGGDMAHVAPDAEGKSKDVPLEKLTNKLNQSINQATGELVRNNATLEGIKATVPMSKIHSLDPNVLELFSGMAKEYLTLTGKSVTVSSAFRSYQDQQALMSKYGAGRAAQPGKSLHEHGLAIDINSKDADELDRLGLMRKYGFTRPIGQERWHIEPAGVALNPTLARENSEERLRAIMSSPGRGGGGYGSDPSAAKYRRNIALQKTIFEEGKSNEVKPLEEIQGKLQQPQSTAGAITQSQTPSVGMSGQAGGANTSSGTMSQSSSSSSSVVGMSIGNKPPEPNQMYNNQSERENKFTTPKGLDKPRDTPYTQNPNADMAGMGDQDPTSIIRKAAGVAGVDPETMLAFAKIESSLRPSVKAPTSNATGLMQIVPGTWNDLMSRYASQYNIPRDAKPTDPYYNALLGSLYAKENMKTLGDYKAAGIRDDVALYLAHHFGPSGGRSIIKAALQNPGASIHTAVSEQAFNANRQELGGRTIGQYIQYLQGKLDKNGSKATPGSVSTDKPLQQKTETAPPITPPPPQQSAGSQPPATPEPRVQNRLSGVNILGGTSQTQMPTPFPKPSAPLPEQPIQPSKALSLDKTESLLSGMSDTLIGIRTILQSIDSKAGMQQPQQQTKSDAKSPNQEKPIVVDSNNSPSPNGVSMSRRPVKA